MNQEIIIFLIGLFSSLIASFISGTLSFISMSTLLAIGIPAHLGLSMLKAGAITHQLSGLYAYAKNNKVIWKYVIPITLIGVPFVILGTKLAISINEELFEKIMKAILLLLIPVTLINKNLGAKKIQVSKKRKYFGYGIYTVLRLLTSVFPFGSGVIMAYHYMHFWGMTLLEFKGTSRVPAMVANIISFTIFASAGIVNWKLSALLAAGMLLGGFMGAKLSIKAGNKNLRYFLIIGMVFLIIKSFI